MQSISARTTITKLLLAITLAGTAHAQSPAPTRTIAAHPAHQHHILRRTLILGGIAGVAVGVGFIAHKSSSVPQLGHIPGGPVLGSGR